MSRPIEQALKYRDELLAHERWYSSEEASKLLGNEMRAQQSQHAVQRLCGSDKLLGVWTGHEYLYPSFQFDTVAGNILRDIPTLLTILPDDETGWRQMLWLCQRHETLNGSRPIDVFGISPKAVLLAARSDFEVSDERW